MDFEKLKIDIESIKETLGSLRFSFAEDYYDAGYALGRAEGWTLLAIHRYIAPAQDAESAQDTAKDTDESAQDDAKGNAKGTEDTEQQTGSVRITIVDSEENRFVPAGDFRVLVGSED